ncbi:MAG: heat-inducible transcriptional repressor HrcA [Clostridia bacterium]
MALSERKKKILQAVVDSYIETANPVSSKDIQEKCLNDCSSATIRNELSALESMGYLVQPHISAGRAPSAKAFRLYVDELMETGPLSEEEIKLVDSYFDHQITSVEDMVGSVAKVLSSITHYTSVVVKGSKNEKLDNIKLLQLNDKSALVVIITDSNIYKDNFIDLPQGIDSKWINKASVWLNKLFAGKRLLDIAKAKGIEQAITEEFTLYRDIYNKVLLILIKMNSGSKYNVITEGATTIFEHPEYDDVGKARDFITAMEDKEEIAEVVKGEQNKGVSITMADGNNHVPEGCSVISSPLNVDGLTIGSAAVIGPVRMNYKKVLSVLDHINKLLDNILDNKEK